MCVTMSRFEYSHEEFMIYFYVNEFMYIRSFRLSAAVLFPCVHEDIFNARLYVCKFLVSSHECDHRQVPKV